MALGQAWIIPCEDAKPVAVIIVITTLPINCHRTSLQIRLTQNGGTHATCGTRCGLEWHKRKLLRVLKNLFRKQESNFALLKVPSEIRQFTKQNVVKHLAQKLYKLWKISEPYDSPQKQNSSNLIEERKLLNLLPRMAISASTLYEHHFPFGTSPKLIEEANSSIIAMPTMSKKQYHRVTFMFA